MEFFIDKVKQHPCLWNMNDISYRDIAKKDFVWDRIATECEMANGQEAKWHWKKLRDSHREALRRRKTPTGQVVPNMRPWKYEAIMDFLLPQLKNSEVYLNYTSASASQDTQQDAPNNENNGTESPPPPPEATHSSSPSVEFENRKQKKHFISNFSDMVQDREKRREQRQTERDDQRRKIIDMKRDPQDALANLFASFCQKTRELPKHLQLRVQREIFDSVTRAEEEALSLDPMSIYYSPSSASSSYRYTSDTNHQTSPLPDPLTDTRPGSPPSPVLIETKPQPIHESWPVSVVYAENQPQSPNASSSQESTRNE